MNEYVNTDAEKALIGCILKQPDLMPEASATIKAKDFSNTAHEVIYKTMLKMLDNKKDIDPITVFSEMNETEQRMAGGLIYITNLPDAVPSTLHYQGYVDEVKKKSKRREMAILLADAIDRIKETETEEVIDYLQTQIMAIQRAGTKRLTYGHEMFHEILYGEPEPAIMTGHKLFDWTLKGLRQGRVVTIAGRPGTGKTAFALDLLARIPEGKKAIYFSFEMLKAEIKIRMVGAETKVKLDRIINKSWSEPEVERVMQSRIQDQTVYKIWEPDDETGGALTVNELKAIARAEKIRDGLDVIFIDYIGLLSPSRPGMKPYEAMTEISKDLKRLARELRVTVIGLAQLNRESTSRASGEPFLSDLRDSGAIEQDSDAVVLLYNPDYQDSTNQSAAQAGGAERLMAKIAKNRNGGVGTIEFAYYKDTQYIEEQR